ncbi:MAG: RNA 2',3'-cyclic phosphodiesterase [Planctomycetota bacterium]|nr:RNA 2',3'-cyclic phosphodiesterase [Planctomycetota bacterium]
MLRTGRVGPQRAVRTFVAIELPDYLREALSGIARRLATDLPWVRWTAPENLHLTVKFLGDVQWNDTGRIGAAIKEEAAKGEPFEIELVGIMPFPPGRSPRIVAVGVVAGEAMSALHAALDRRMEEFGIRPEDRAFLPHLTLGRVRDGRARDMAGVLAPLAERGIGAFDAEEVVFFQSELRPEGPLYTPLCRAKLGG